MTNWRRTAVWIGAAVAGLVLAAALTTAAATLSDQRVGLSSEPLSAGDDLAPSPTASPTPTRTARPKPTRTARPRRTATPTAARTAVPTVDDDDNSGHGGGGDDDDDGGRGRGRGRGGDDD
jgi:hypothetical protein